MESTILWLLLFAAAAIPAQLLWGRMLRTLRDHQVQYDRGNYNLDALSKYVGLVKRGPRQSNERRVLLWLYVAMGLTWAAFLGLLTTLAIGGK